MAYLIDTSIAIQARDGTQAVLDTFEEHDGAVLPSALSLTECGAACTTTRLTTVAGAHDVTCW